MDPRTLLRELWQRRLLTTAVLLVSAYVGVSVAYEVRLFPPSLAPKQLEIAAASTRVLVDSPRFMLGNVEERLDPLSTRAAVYTELLASPPIKAQVAEAAGIPNHRFAAQAHVNSMFLTRSDKEPSTEERGNELVDERKVYRLFVETQPDVPTIGIATQAPTPEEAERVANAASLVLRRHVEDVQARSGVRPRHRVELRQLGAPDGATVNPGVNKVVVALSTPIVIAAGLFALIIALRIVAAVRSIVRGSAARAST